jgi:hypothetical protein
MTTKPLINQPLIPPNINPLKESASILLQEPLEPLKISQEPLKFPIQIKETTKEPNSLMPPLESIPPLEKPTFY